MTHTDVRMTLRLAKDRPTQMLAAYRANAGRSLAKVRQMIIEDISRFSDLGACGYVMDLEEALLRFDKEAL